MMIMMRMGHERISRKREGKGKDSEGWKGWKYTVYMHVKTAQ
jgi:hypothetical protein